MIVPDGKGTQSRITPLTAPCCIAIISLLLFMCVFTVGVGLITRQQCEQAVLEVTGQGRDGTVKLFDVISAFDAPRYIYDREQQKFKK